MPYKAVGNWVMVYKGGKWNKLKQHASAKKAQKHAQALNINAHRK